MPKINYNRLEDELKEHQVSFREHDMERMIKEARRKIIKQPVIPESNHYIQEDDQFRTYKREQEIQTVGPLGFPYKF